MSMTGILSGLIGVALAYLTTFAVRCVCVRHRDHKEQSR